MFYRPLAQAGRTKFSVTNSNPPALFRCRWYDGERFVHRDGTNHPVIKRAHVVKYDAGMTKQIVGV